MEHFRSSAFLYDEDDIRDYVHAADALRQTAMNPAESLDVIGRYADKVEARQ
ncbi:Scr1 family TA system antitoxin-like transcriptional regulator [Actinopolyspora erythraea]|uniref:Scr1 family TA system antitoxin-like transcriptional regulator n=1 Tax=Actinopolyspora erythraea TaxID=414996 RepID=UPI001E45F27C|nr:Scr1 family TA system antitoxin-like transcriptional regulator [Actinopolyspora erythraea]